MRNILIGFVMFLLLAGVGVLAYLYVTQVSDAEARISELTDERDASIRELASAEDELEQMSRFKSNPMFFDAGDDAFIALRPDGYTIEFSTLSNQGPFVSWSAEAHSVANSFFYKSTTEDIVVVPSISYEHLAGSFSQAFVDVENQTIIQQARDTTSLTDNLTRILFQVDGEQNVFELSTDAPCQNLFEPYATEELVDQCNQSNPDPTLSQLLVNGEVVASVEPVSLDISYPDGLGAFVYGETVIEFLGVSPDLSLAYFSFLDETYSINRAGDVITAEVPEDVVTMTDASYE